MESTSRLCDHVLHTNQKENKNSHSEPKNKIRNKYKNIERIYKKREQNKKHELEHLHILINGKEYKKYRSKIKLIYLNIQKENKKHGKEM